jgi:hypothetical protein
MVAHHQPALSTRRIPAGNLLSRLHQSSTRRLAGVAMPRASPRRTMRVVQVIDFSEFAARQ